MVASLHQQRALRACQDPRTEDRGQKSFEMKKKTEAGVEQPRPDPRSPSSVERTCRRVEAVPAAEAAPAEDRQTGSWHFFERRPPSCLCCWCCCSRYCTRPDSLTEALRRRPSLSPAEKCCLTLRRKTPTTTRCPRSGPEAFPGGRGSAWAAKRLGGTSRETSRRRRSGQRAPGVCWLVSG